MLIIKKATIYLLSEKEGGIQDGFSGMRPSFNISGELIACSVYSLDHIVKMPRGHSYNVKIELPYGEKVFNNTLKEGMTFNLQIASKIIATGEIIEI